MFKCFSNNNILETMKLHNSNGKLWERNKYFMSCSSLPRVSGNKRINLVEKSRRSNLVKKMYTK